MTRIDSPLARYARATAPDGWLTADGWLRLAADLDAYAELIVDDCIAMGLRGGTPERAIAAGDRAADCRDRAAAIRACALDTLRDISRPL